jgi:ABC-type nickel/cobalt efflux system permease component RcnA
VYRWRAANLAPTLVNLVPTLVRFRENTHGHEILEYIQRVAFWCIPSISLWWSWSPMGLATRNQAHLPCPDRGQSPQSRGSGPHRQHKYNWHVNQSSSLPHTVYPHRGSDPLWRRSSGMDHCRTHYHPAGLLRRRRPRFTFYLKTCGMDHLPQWWAYGSRSNHDPTSFEP